MNVQLKWQGIPASPFIESYLMKEVGKLERQFPGSNDMAIRFRREGVYYRARVHVRAMGRDWWVVGEGANLVEGLHQAFENLQRKIGEFKRFSRDKINRRFRRPVSQG
jgi:hypothetical protein